MKRGNRSAHKPVLGREIYHSVVEAGPNAIVMVDAKRKIVFVNVQMEQLFGYPREELIGKEIEILVPERFRSQHPGHVQGFFQDPKARPLGAGRDLFGLKKNGTEIPIEIGLSPIKVPEGLFVLASIIDITERKKAEALLYSTRVQLETQKKALDQFAIVVETDKKGKITYVNDQFCATSKYTREELIGSDHRDVANSGYHSREFWQNFWATIQAGKIWRGDVCNKAKDGTIYWEDTSIVPFPGKDGKPEKYLAIRANITERKRAEEHLEAANQRLEELNRLKDEFVATVSHELRTPLTAIKESASLIRDGVTGSVNKEQKYFLTTIDQSVNRLTKLIADMLDLAKIEAGRMKFKRRKVSVKDLIKTTLKNYESITGNRKLKADILEVPDVFADHDKIQQVLGNLLSNAIKFTTDGGTITFAAQEQNGEVVIAAQDNGLGIAKEDIPKLFQKFSQVGAAEKKPGGTGLGLALCKEIVESHKGRISVTSELAKGSQFAFTLPVYTSKLVLEESFAEQLEIAKESEEDSIGLIVIDSETLIKNSDREKHANAEECLKEVMSLLRRNLHRTDAVLTIDPHWIVILAAMNSSGMGSLSSRLLKILKNWTSGSFGFGTASYPSDGADVHSLLKKATTRSITSQQEGR